MKLYADEYFSVRRIEADLKAEEILYIIAELDGEPVGLGALVIASEELRACYVEPKAARKGVGTALVREIERIAEQSGLQRLELLASVNAESFYTFLGYQADRRTEHVLSTGVSMAAVKMAKTLR